MPKRTSGFREDLLADLADPYESARYLNAALEDSEKLALVALRDIAEARQMARVAKGAGVAREAIYRMLRESGNPTFSNPTAILKTVGLELRVAPIPRGKPVTALSDATPKLIPYSRGKRRPTKQ